MKNRSKYPKETIEVNGMEYEFMVYANYMDVCPVCGAYACGSNERYLWFEQEGKRHTIIFDDRIFDALSDIVFAVEQTQESYALLPQYFRDWNECTGWEDFDNLEGFVLDIDELLAFLHLANNRKLDEASQAMFEGILEHVEKAKADSACLQIAKL